MKATRRQGARRLAGIASVLIFPASFYYFSPYLSLFGASQGIVAGSVLLFALLFLSSLALGRLFCSWVCPAGALQDLVATGRRKLFDRARYGWIKYLIWAPWLLALLFLFCRRGSSPSVVPAYSTEWGLSATSAPALVMYLMIALTFFGLSAIFGKRAACHAICWMAPFMVLGKALSRSSRLPALRLSSDRGACLRCKACDKVCPMSLETSELALKADPDRVDCILCGECVDACPSGCLRLAWRRPVVQAAEAEKTP